MRNITRINYSVLIAASPIRRTPSNQTGPEEKTKHIVNPCSFWVHFNADPVLESRSAPLRLTVNPNTKETKSTQIADASRENVASLKLWKLI